MKFNQVSTYIEDNILDVVSLLVLVNQVSITKYTAIGLSAFIKYIFININH